MRGTSKKTLFVTMAACAALAGSGPAWGQAHIDEPALSPMLFGKTQQEREDEQRLRDANYRGDPNFEQIDDPDLNPIIGGPSQMELEQDRNATRVTLGEEDDNRGFFSAFNFLTPDETNLSLGVGPVYRPDYFGSDDYEFDADPQVYVKFRNFVFLDDDGADFALFGFSRFRVGPSIRIQGRRDQDDNPALQGLGDVGTTFEFGGFVATTFLDRFSVKAKARHGLKTGHRGTIIDANINALLFRAGPVSIAAGGQASWIGNRYADAYFSVTPEQSVRSNGVLPVFDADAGFRDFGGNVTAYINVRDRWSLNPYASYQVILGDIADTPIIDQFGDKHQFRVGFHLMREFRF